MLGGMTANGAPSMAFASSTPYRTRQNPAIFLPMVIQITVVRADRI
jgi:hypothetical protein